MKKTLVLFLLCLGASACNKAGQGTNAQNPNTPGVGEQYVVTTFTTLRLSPSNAAEVNHPLNPAASITNWVGVIRRGVSVTVVSMTPGWYQVKVDNGGEGWIETSNLLNVKKIQSATILANTPVYPTESEATAPVTVLPAGELLFILQAGPQMTQVNNEHFGAVWVSNSALTQDPVEVGMADLIIEAKEAGLRRDIDEAGEALDEARIKYPQLKAHGRGGGSGNHLQNALKPVRSNRHVRAWIGRAAANVCDVARASRIEHCGGYAGRQCQLGGG